MKKQLSPWGKQCKAQMIILGKSLYDVSEETNLSRSYISAIINGRIVAPESTLEAISKSLEVEMPVPAA